MTHRVFSSEVRSTLTCKPGYGEIALCSLGELDAADIPLIGSYEGTTDRMIHCALAAACEEARLMEIVEFAVALGKRVYLVNSEGYDYPRYCGYLSLRSSKEVLKEATIAMYVKGGV